MWVGMQIGTVIMEKFLKKIKNRNALLSSNLLLGMYPKELERSV
jgi:hypothetical protein